MPKKLVELLVVEPQLKQQAAATLKDLGNTFEKKRHLFEEKRKTFHSTEDGADSQPVIEEQSDIQTSVIGELNWVTDLWAKAIDTSYQVAEGNTKARADVTLDDGKILMTGVTALALLELQKRAKELQDLIMKVPTLDPAKAFSPDPTHAKPNVFKARERSTTRTKKVQEVLVLAPATDKHPAQVNVISVDRPIGTVMEQEWSGMITPARKAKLIERVEELRRAFTSALHRANVTEVDDVAPKVAKKIFDYVLTS